MNFAFTPDDGRPPRLIRYVEAGNLPAGVLAAYDREQNLLLIDRGHAERLSPEQIRALERTHERVVRVDSEEAKLVLDQIDIEDFIDWPEAAE